MEAARQDKRDAKQLAADGHNGLTTQQRAEEPRKRHKRDETPELPVTATQQPGVQRNGTPITEEEAPRATLQVCGIPTTARNVVFGATRQSMIANEESNMIRTLLADETKSVLLWHSENEPCGVRRPYSDIYMIFGRKAIRDATICAHLHQSTSSDSDSDDASSDHELHTASSVNVRLEWSTHTQFELDWQKPSLLVETTASIANLRAQIRQAIVDCLRQADHSQYKLKKGQELRFRTLLDGTDSPGSSFLDLDNASYGGRIETVSDLFRGGSRSLRAVVQISIDDSSKEKARKDDTLATAADFDSMVRYWNVEDRRQYWRIGDAKRKEGGPKEIQVEWPLITEAIPPDHHSKLKLWCTSAWDFGDFCIGGMEITKEDQKFKQALAWSRGYEGVRNCKELRDRLSKPTTPDPRYPFLPPLTFNSFDPEQTEPPMGPVSMGKKAVTVVVRFVSHLTHAEANEMDFHDNYQFDAKGHETRADLKELVVGSLLQDTPELFEGRLKGCWNLGLYIMPQSPGPRKLFPFSTLRSGAPAKVQDFVSKQAFEKGHRKLYMEAHIWPKDRKVARNNVRSLSASSNTDEEANGSDATENARRYDASENAASETINVHKHLVDDCDDDDDDEEILLAKERSRVEKEEADLNIALELSAQEAGGGAAAGSALSTKRQDDDAWARDVEDRLRGGDGEDMDAAEFQEDGDGESDLDDVYGESSMNDSD